MGRYAAETTVSVARSRAEIEELLERYHATKIAVARDETQAQVAFAMRDRMVRFTLPLPARNDKHFTHDRYGYTVRDELALKKWEQACRQRWRALLLVIKAKLESVESQIETFEQAFLAHIVVPGTGRTISEHLVPQLADLTKGRGVPQLPALTHIQ